MNTRALRRGALVLTLLATGGACTSPGKSFSNLSSLQGTWNDSVDRAIPDPARAARIKALGAELAEVQRVMAREVIELNQQAVTLNGTYGATAEEAHRLFDAYEARRRKGFARYRDLVFALRAEATESEWKALTQ